MMAQNDDGGLLPGWWDVLGLPHEDAPARSSGGGSTPSSGGTSDSGGSLGGTEYPGDVNPAPEESFPGYAGGLPPGYTPNPNPNGPNYPIDALGPGGPNTFQNPLYQAGAELDIMSSMTPNQIANIQGMLESLGIIEEGSYIPDMLDSTTLNGFEDLLALSNANGMTWQQMSSALQAQGGVPGGGGPSRAPLVTRTSDPDTLKRYLRRTVVEMTGSSQSPDIDIDQMVEAYQRIEIENQQALYNAQVAGGNVQNIPTFDEYAAGQVEDQFATEVQANSAGELIGSLFQKIASGQV